MLNGPLSVLDGLFTRQLSDVRGAQVHHDAPRCRRSRPIYSRVRLCSQHQGKSSKTWYQSFQLRCGGSRNVTNAYRLDLNEYEKNT